MRIYRIIYSLIINRCLRGFCSKTVPYVFLYDFWDFFYKAAIQLLPYKFGSYIYPCFSNVYKFN